MKAVGYIESLPIDREDSLIDLDLPVPVPGPRDLLVRVEAVSVNPLDAAVRKRRTGTPAEPAILGWDAAGVVEAVGESVTMFRPGDAVFYSGSLNRPGSNAEYQLVDERVTALKPRSLSFAEAASLPLTTITAWESLFDRLRLPVGKGHTDDAILIVGAAGGIGSIAVQLVKRLTALPVIATASRPDSADWVRRLGADDVIDHTRPLSQELARIGRPAVRYILALTHTDRHWDEIVAALAPQGHVCITDNPVGIDPMKLRGKAGALHVEMMWVRVIHDTPEIIQIHRMLTEVAKMVDDGLVKPTVGHHYGTISAANLRRAHAAIETGRTVGKIVLDGFGGGNANAS